MSMRWYSNDRCSRNKAYLHLQYIIILYCNIVSRAVFRVIPCLQISKHNVVIFVERLKVFKSESGSRQKACRQAFPIHSTIDIRIQYNYNVYKHIVYNVYNTFSTGASIRVDMQVNLIFILDCVWQWHAQIMNHTLTIGSTGTLSLYVAGV